MISIFGATAMCCALIDRIELSMDLVYTSDFLFIPSRSNELKYQSMLY